MIGIEQWRRAIAGSGKGCNRRKRKRQRTNPCSAQRGASSFCLAMYAATVVCFLLVIGGVEQHPGPQNDVVSCKSY